METKNPSENTEQDENTGTDTTDSTVSDAEQDSEPMERQVIDIAGVGSCNQVSVVKYDRESRITHVFRCAPGTKIRTYLEPDERIFVVACGPVEHDELLASLEEDTARATSEASADA